MAWRNYYGQKGGGKEKGKDGKSGGKWQYWAGAWSPAQKHHGPPWKNGKHNAHEAASSNLVIPGYDAAGKEVKNITEVASVHKETGDTYATALQKAINQVRKTEGRVRKLASDKQARLTQWNNWVQELRKSYAKEKLRYQSAMEKLARDMEEAQLEQAGAQAALRKVAANVDTGGEMEIQPGDMLEFDTLMQTQEVEEHVSKETNAEILKRTMQATMYNYGQTPCPHAGNPVDVPTTPQRPIQGTGVGSTPLHVKKGEVGNLASSAHGKEYSAHPMAPPSGSPGVTSDPYLVSPATHVRRTVTPPIHRRASPTSEGSKRESLKADARPQAPKYMAAKSLSLAEKLAISRARMSTENNAPVKGVAEDGGTDQSKTVPERHIICDDDEDDHDLSDPPSDLEQWYHDKYKDQTLETLE